MLLRLLSIAIALHFGYCQGPGQKVPMCELSKDVIVQLSGWKYTDIENECLASSSRYYCAFQINSPFEHQVVNMSLPIAATNPWWQRYHQVSWLMAQTEAGTLAELSSMLQTCNANNIRIYIDLEVNNAGDNTGPGFGTSGSYYDGRVYQYAHFNGQSFYHLPDGAVPEGCPSTSGRIDDQSDIDQIRHCNRLSAAPASSPNPIPELLDLKTHLEEVRSRFIDNINILINGIGGDAEQGIAGFRFAHARYINPADLRYIANSAEDIKIPGINDIRPFFYSEVLPDAIVSETEYYDFGNVEESRAGPLLSDIVRQQHPTYRLANLTLWGPQMGLMATQDAIVYIDDPASQRGWPEMTDLDKTLRFDDPINYQTANAFMLAHPYGVPRVHSSYFWPRVLFVDGSDGLTKDWNDYQGPPRFEGGDTGEILDVVISSDGNSCEGNWTCEHRWLSIRGLARFRNVMNQAGADNVNNYWTNGYEQIAFSRGNFGFFVINNENNIRLNADIYTSMPQGTYCDLATGADPTASPCQGRTVTVNSAGRALINLAAGADPPFIAIAAL